ncbi:hypothetical protein HMPREF1635_05880 [Clostridiales bacterium S5-A14a]|nr:hypothetical protein HMPREF1635_05880 [Clostridiales bacterium S5-A14a]
MKKNNTFEEFAAALVEGDNFAIFPHVDPDGDALGASVSLALALSSIGKNVKILIDEAEYGGLDIKEELLFIDSEKQFFTVDSSFVAEKTYGIMMDCGEISRIAGRLNRDEIFRKCSKTFCLDHHASSTPLADFNVIIPETAATCQLVWQLFKSMQKYGLVVDKAMAEAVYVGILTDTGGFRYSNTSAETHIIASEIFALGADHYAISKQVFESNPLRSMKLKFAAMGVADFSCGNRIAITYVDSKMLKSAGATLKDSDGIVEEVRIIDSVEVACLCKEQADGSVKVSMRSKTSVDVSKIGMKFSGGGHKRAAGCTIHKPIAEAVKLMKSELKAAVEAEYYGIININKAPNMTSHDVVAIIRRKLGIKKVGHTGTLDPMATGVLPVAIGNATRFIEYLDKDVKTYVAGVKLGIMTDTLDIWGESVHDSRNINKIDFDTELIIKTIQKFKGVIEQEPPMYSAIKVDGKKLYEYARKEEEVEIPKRKIKIFDIEYIDKGNKEYLEDLTGIRTELTGIGDDPTSMIAGTKNIRPDDESDFYIKVKCSRGTYVRSLIRDIGCELGTDAVMSFLVRTKSGEFSITDACNIDEIKELDSNKIKDFIVPIDSKINYMGRIQLEDSDSIKFQNGGKVSLKNIKRKDAETSSSDDKRNIYLVYNSLDQDFLGTGRIVDGKYLKAEKVLPR